MDPKKYVDGEVFHSSDLPVYQGPIGWAVNKKAAGMAQVLYRAPHENLQEEGVRRGHGKDHAIWIFSEEGPKAEGLFRTPLELMIDATFEPGAAVGLHHHAETEEVYYLISGSITMTTVAPTGEESTQHLEAGDAHLVRLGQSHFGVAGPAGARCIVVALRACVRPASSPSAG